VRHADTLEGLRALLIEVGAAAVRSGLVLASGGNLSARLPGADEFLVTGAGTWFDRLSQADFSRLRVSDGARLDGAEQPSTEWKLHWRTYRARPDVNAIVHLHPQHAVLVDALGEEIRLITLDHATYVRSVGRVPLHPNGSDEAFRRAANLEEAAVASYRLLLLGDRTLRYPGTAAHG
jgi:L-fuculose-phosphate aldolase